VDESHAAHEARFVGSEEGESVEKVVARRFSAAGALAVERGDRVYGP
jgi:hypothetical protein